MGLVMTITVGSTIQVALLTAPLLVFISHLLGHPMNLVFSNPLEMAAIAAVAFVVNAISQDGETTWFEGVLLDWRVRPARAGLFLRRLTGDAAPGAFRNRPSIQGIEVHLALLAGENDLFATAVLPLLDAGDLGVRPCRTRSTPLAGVDGEAVLVAEVRVTHFVLTAGRVRRDVPSDAGHHRLAGSS